jgi:CP family cyanate transporter-like MFS transporter
MDALSDQAEARHRGAKSGGGAYRWLKPPVLRHPAWAVAAVLLIGFNLRPSITTVALFLGDIKRDLGVSVFGISVLAMLPVVCLGLFAPAAPALARRFGVETVLFVSLLGIVIGSVVRSFGVAPLYLGTVIIGACLCFLGVLSPAVVKRDFPRHIGLTMGFYTMLVCVGPALSAATAVPFQHVLGGNWELVLVIWGLPALVGALAVLPRLFAHDADIRVATPHVLDLLGLVRDPLAWQVTAYFGLISALAYAVFNWGPSMLQARGLDATESGLILSVCYISQTFAGLLAPIVAGKWRDQRLIVAAMVVLTALGLLGFVYAPVSSLKLVAFVLGIGQGGAFGVALLLFALRSRDPHSASQLSAMAQTVGYVFGGVAGPFAVGVIFDWTGSWTVVSLFFVAVSFASLVSGIGAGRARTVRPLPARL